ncbi:TetR/AcrR family transcriptional regulator [Nocardioides immobilis]|uniref:TetR/AcrR family transcriptional regulator n=2 Tax=Nocardioides immobilis TaxID=2049295 RepID=A0A417XVN9_9ACTN|nr:TetR/AcrR family transcriptional regulator [Nocardioides immobilis]
MAPEERREQLLDAVLRVIVKQGVHKVSMDSVAKEAGVTRPVVYGHFADSAELLRASLVREEQAALAQLATVLPAMDGGSPAEVAIESLAKFLSAVREAPERWQAIFSLVDSSTPEFRARVAAGQKLVIGAFEQIIRWAMTDGLDPATDVEMLARALFALFWDAGRLVLAEPETFPAERIVAFGRQTIERYLQQ